MCGPQVRAGGNAGDAELTLGEDMHKVSSCSTNLGTNSLFPLWMVKDFWGILAEKAVARAVQKYLCLSCSNATVTSPILFWNGEMGCYVRDVSLTTNCRRSVENKQTNKQTAVIYSLKQQNAKDHSFFPNHNLDKLLNDFGILAHEF